MKQNKTLIIVPAFNESGNIGRTIREIQALQKPLDILVIDDGSCDATVKEAKAEKVPVLSLPFNLGIGGAVQTGFLYAYQNDYDVAVQVDGDGQHDLSYLVALCAPILKGESDAVVGSRFIGPFLGYRSSLIRRLGIHFFARLISFLTQYNVTDSTSGYRAFNKKSISVFAHDYPVDFPEPESIVIAKRQGLRLIEVPVQMRERQKGHSSIRYVTTLYYMIKVTFAILLNIIKKKKAVK